MTCRSLIGLVGVVVLAMATGIVKASEDMKYPNWKGQWGRFIVRGLPGQPSFDQTKGWGPYQQAPLTAEYQKVLEESMADQEKGGLGNYSTARCLPGGASTPMGATGRRTLSRPIRAIRSANGSTRTATAAMTCLKSRRAARSRGPGLTTRPACPCISTINPPSRSVSISTRPIPTFFMTRSL